MFKIPEWGADIPHTNINLKDAFPKGKKNKNTESKGKPKELKKLHEIKKPNFKAKKCKNMKLVPKNNKLNLKQENVTKKSISYQTTNKVDNKQIPKNNFQNTNSKQKSFALNNSNKKHMKLLKNQISNKIQIPPQTNENSQKDKRRKSESSLREPPKVLEKSNNSRQGVLSDKNNKRKKSKNLIIENCDADNIDEIIINQKKNKIVASYQKDDNLTERNNKYVNNNLNEVKFEHANNKLNEAIKNGNDNIYAQTNKRKMILKTMLAENKHKTDVTVNTGSKLRESSKLRERMLERLNAAKFRYLNEKLYTSSGIDAQKIFAQDPAAFQTYHHGFQQQVKKWPVNPLDVVVKRIQRMPKTHFVVDMGCGDAVLAKQVAQTVRSFDLVAAAPGVEACDMAHTPLLAQSVDVAVYCLALMGTDLTQYLIEANRILKVGGHLLIAEVESRFDNVDTFTKEVQRLGFALKKLDNTYKVFFFMEFVKAREAPTKKSKLPTLSLKPCLYKKR